MMHRFATLAAVCVLAPLSAAPTAFADPAPADPAAAPAVPAADAAPPPPPVDTGVVASEVPGIAHTPDGRTLTVAAKNETQLPVAPLTTSLSSREWLVGGTFTGSGMGEVKGGTLEVGYQIGCGIEMDKIKLNGSIGIGAGSLSLNPTAAAPVGLGSLTVPIQGQIEVEPRPGTITNVAVDKKSFKGDATRVTVKDVHIKVDNCVGASSLRSYAVLTSSGTDADDIVAYYGVAKVF
ncbi:MAG: MspA family porin [Mycobacterium sp.]